MKAVVVQYEVQPGFVEQNAANIREVMAELQAQGDAGIRYQAFQGTGNPNQFTHIGFYADEEAQARATSLASFQKFQTELKASGPVAPPKPTWLQLIDSGHAIFD